MKTVNNYTNLLILIKYCCTFVNFVNLLYYTTHRTIEQTYAPLSVPHKNENT